LGKLKDALNKTSKQEYLVTKAKLKRWFDIINEEVFANDLIKIQLKVHDHPYELYEPTKRYSDVRAYYIVEDVDTEQEYSYIIVKRQFPSLQLFLKVLVHEMVHHFTWSNDRILNHGPVFKKWKKPLKLHNCPLQYILYE
jgi:hypothetical protein